MNASLVSILAQDWRSPKFWQARQVSHCGNFGGAWTWQSYLFIRLDRHTWKAPAPSLNWLWRSSCCWWLHSLGLGGSVLWSISPISCCFQVELWSQTQLKTNTLHRRSGSFWTVSNLSFRQKRLGHTSQSVLGSLMQFRLHWPCHMTRKSRSRFRCSSLASSMHSGSFRWGTQRGSTFVPSWKEVIMPSREQPKDPQVHHSPFRHLLPWHLDWCSHWSLVPRCIARHGRKDEWTSASMIRLWS